MATFEIDEKRFDIIKEAVSSDCISIMCNKWLATANFNPWMVRTFLTLHKTEGAITGALDLCRSLDFHFMKRFQKSILSSFCLQYMRSLNNFRAEQPHQHAMYYLRLLMTEVAWTKDELREALDGEMLLSISQTLSSSTLNIPVCVAQTEVTEVQCTCDLFPLLFS